MRAPDGITTASVSKDHDKHTRTRQNAWAEFSRWQRRTTDTTTHPLEDPPMATVLVCPECQATFGDAKALEAHTADAHKPMRPALLCPECGETFWKANQLSFHLIRVHPDSPHTPEAEPSPCPDCDFVGRSPASLLQHKRNVHPWGVCPLCGDKVTSERGLSMHLTGSHPEDKERVLAMPKVKVHATKAPEPEAVPEPEPEPERNVVLDYLVQTTTGKDAEQMVAAIRAVVAPPLVDEVRKLREHNAKLERELDTTTKALADANARLELIRDTMGV